MFAGMSTQAAQTLDPNYMVTPVCNWFFMFVSTFLITAVGTFVTDKLVEPHLGKYEGAVDGATEELTPAEKRGGDQMADRIRGEQVDCVYRLFDDGVAVGGVNRLVGHRYRIQISWWRRRASP